VSTDHHLVVSWIWWWRVLLNRPVKPKLVLRVNWENLVVESSTYTSGGVFPHIAVEVEDMGSEWAMF